MFRHVLLILDGTIAGEAAVPVAAELAEREGARLTIARVLRTGSGASLRQAPEAAGNAAEAYLRRVAARTALPPGTVQTVVLAGPLPRAALRYAQAEGVDLIVVGEDPSGEWPDREIRTATEHLVGQAHCPVLLVPAGAFRHAAV